VAAVCQPPRQQRPLRRCLPLLLLPVVLGSGLAATCCWLLLLRCKPLAQAG
jgi:hypothetical protein